jgi:simple sugar transport system permease protein
VIVTLVTLVAVRLLDWRLAGGFPALLPANAPSWIFAGFLGPGGLVRVSLVWFGAAVALGWVLLAIPGVGERIRASGRSRRKRVPGVPVRRIRAACFVVCAVLAGWAGLIQMLRVGSPLPSLGVAPGWQGWAAALIGGALPVGGLGSVPGALIGTVVVVAIDRLAGGEAPLWSAVAILLLAALCAGAGLFRARGGV